MNYNQVKTEHQRRYDELFTACGVFWAFSNEQFAEGKKEHPVKEGEKYTSIGSGGFMPSANYPQLEKGLKDIKKWYKQAMKEVKSEQAILHELNNYECFYSCDIDDVVEYFEGKYTIEEIRKVYRKYTNLNLQTEKAKEATL